MTSTDLLEPVADAEAEMARVAYRFLTTALDHSRAPQIALLDGEGHEADGPKLILPPQALRFFAEVLRILAQQQAVVLMPQRHELTTQEAATFLNVSRPYVIKEIEAGRLQCRKVNRHRRIEFSELQRYKAQQQQSTSAALQQLAELAEDLEMDY
ncbi:MAG: helix-turn-helix domain-containing protein [Curvibacter sp.]|nr:helix-turn-helix domain-containing protein [Curvibacter sp.]